MKSGKEGGLKRGNEGLEGGTESGREGSKIG